IGSLTATGITAGAVTQIDGNSQAVIADASNMTSNTATIEHPVIVKNNAGVETTYTVTQTIAKAIGGAAGSSGALIGNTSIATGDSTKSLTVPSVDSAVSWDPDGYTATSDTDNLISPHGAAVSNHLIEIDKTGLYKVRGFCYKITPTRPADNSYTWKGRLRLRKSSGGQ
ncbi:MAG TPA: hypothetical protein DF712_03140, partial [Balneola sp.]|nr:hypothetical protein [Balneola sp.]